MTTRETRALRLYNEFSHKYSPLVKGIPLTMDLNRGPRALCLLLLLLMATLGLGQVADTESSYVFGPEDVFTVTVLRHPEFSGDFLIPTNGAVELPAVGTLKLDGVTIQKATQLITAKLKSRLVKPEVSVTLKAPRIRRAYVLGDVKVPGVYDIKPGWGLAEAITSAGGLAQGVQTRDVQVTLRSAVGKSAKSLPLNEAIADRTLTIQPGDLIQVQTVELVPVYVAGHVKNPGVYPLRTDALNVLAVIAQAGGATDDASLGAVRIVRPNGTEEVVDLSPSLVKGDSIKLPTVGRGDMVIVSEQLNKFAVLGYVSKPGYFPMSTGRAYTVADAVALASGADRRGRLTRIGLVRVENGKEVRRVVDLSRYLQKGDLTQNPTLSPGDVVFVPETDRAEPSTIMSALSSAVILFNAVRR